MIDAARTTLDLSLGALERRLVGVGGPFELGFGPSGALRYLSGPQSLADLYGRARRMGPKPLLARGEEHRCYSEIFEPALAVAASLRRQGWAGRRIALALDDGPEWLIWFVAITAAGASCVLPSPNGSADLMLWCCEVARCDAMAAPASHPLDGCGLTNLYDGAPEHIEGAPTLDVRPEVEAIVAFTSGSSGAPKGVVHSHRSLITGLRNMMLGGALANHMVPTPSVAPERPQSPSTLLLSPFAYVAGYSAFLLCIATAGRIVLPESGGEDAIVKAIKTEGVQALGGASPDLVRRLIRQPAAPESLRSLRRLQLHGSALQRSLVDELRDVVPAAQLFTGYGSSETAGSVAVAAVEQVISQPGGCGRLLPSVELRVVDERDVVLPTGADGHVQIRGEMLMSGYLDESGTARAMTDDKWYRTDDIGRLEEGRWLAVLGRGNDRIAEMGAFVAPAEDAVRAACGVDDVAVAPSTDGTALILYLQVQPRQVVDTAVAVEALKSTAMWTGPVDVRLLKAFPRTASGKLDRQGLDA